MAQRLLTTLMLGWLLSGPVGAAEVLRVLAWPGYADTDLVQAFERAHQVRVEVTFVASDEVLRQKVSAHQGRDFDVIAANTVEIQRLVSQGMLAGLDLANIPNQSKQLPNFRDTAGIVGLTEAGQTYAIPYTYSEMGLIYDRQQFPTAPSSLAVMWDPRFQGKVLAFNDAQHNFSVASLALGGSPFQIVESAFKPLTLHLIKLRRNVLTFYTLPEEAVDLFRDHSVAVLFANYGRQQFKLLQDAGADVGYVIPREGALAWLDCWAVTRGAKNKRLAERWINHMLGSQASEALIKRQGLANTVDADPNLSASDRMLWLQAVENDARRAALWARIVSGDLPQRF